MTRREEQRREEARLHDLAVRVEERGSGMAERLLDLVRDLARPGGLEDDLEPQRERDEEEEDG